MNAAYFIEDKGKNFGVLCVFSGYNKNVFSTTLSLI
jgi:hypothetical protein